MGDPAVERIVVRAATALRSAAQASPVAFVGPLADDLEDAWRELPLRVGLRGGSSDRMQLIEAVVGGPLGGRACAAIAVTRGAQGRVRVTHADGRVEQHADTDASQTIPVDEKWVVASAALAPRADSEAEPPTDVRFAGPGNNRPTVAIAALAAPRYVREKPAWWAVWAWIARWWWLRKHGPPAAPHTVEPAPVVAAPRARAPAPAPAPAAPAPPSPRPRYRDQLASLAAEAGAQLAIEVANGPLAVDVALLELADDASAAFSTVDLVVSVKDHVVFAIDLRDERARRIGPVATAAAALADEARWGRALKLGWRAVEVLRSVEAKLGDIVASADARFRGRVAELEALAVDDRAGFVAAQLAALRSEIITRASSMVKQLLAHVGGELDRVETAWTSALTDTTTTEQLATTLERIDQTAPTVIDEIVGDARRLVASSSRGAGHDVGALALAVLVDKHRLPADRVRDLAAAPTTLASLLAKLNEASATALAGGKSWFAGLFKSFDAKRSEALAKLRARITQLRELANAELLDVEPRLYATLGESIEQLLASALDRHADWLAERVASERAAIAVERELMAPLVLARDAAHADAHELAAAMARS